ncbi:MAG TPA: hypothetical protein VM755_19810 [Stellaceae bacterium]|nr:hypothetical protein [Stellaceae bacterium]
MTAPPPAQASAPLDPRQDFLCIDCGWRIRRAVPVPKGEPPLCAACLMLPGWMDVPELAAIFDPKRGL